MSGSEPERLIEWTGERCTPWADDAQVVYEHYHRYALARSLAGGARVLDLGCGEGYGSAMLGEVAESVVGVDVDETTVEHARLHHGGPSVTFAVGSMTDTGLDVADGSIDLVVCLEALEHVSDHDAVTTLVRRVLAPNGVFLVSTPDVEVYSHDHGNDNPFHVRELTEGQFRDFLGTFSNHRLLRQNVATGSVIAAEDSVLPGEVLSLVRAARGWAVQHAAPHTYLLGVATDGDLPDVPSVSTLVEPTLEIVAAHQRAHAGTAERGSLRESELLAAIELSRRDLEAAQEATRRMSGQVVDLQAAAESAASQVIEHERRERQLEHDVRQQREAAAGELATTGAALSAALARADEAERTLVAERAMAAARIQWLAELRRDAEALASHLLPRAAAAEEWNGSGGARAIARYRQAVEQVAPRGSLRRRSYERLRGSAATAPPATVAAPSPPVDVRTSEHPVVTVIVPVHGQWEHTRRCLLSIEAARAGVPFEVVVVDDASPDDTADRIAGCRGVRLVRLDRNVGFIGACNAGAEQARSELLVFLNNDTEVAPGWLDALVDAAQADPRVGAVGSKLVASDGTLQECGGIVWGDGSGWNTGRGGAVSGPVVDVPRPVDYCSGASLLVKAVLFRQLGGFDERYAPAYYEDVDLAFGIRSLGHTVVVEPRSVVLHHEGGSHGTDTSSGVKRYQVVNQRTFRDKWAAELASRPREASPGGVWLHRQHSPRGLVVVADHAVPRPDHDAGSVRMRRVLELLVDLGFGVVFLPHNHATPEPYTTDLQRKGVTVLADPGAQEVFLAEAAPHLTMALLSRQHVAFRHLEQLRKTAPQCTVVFDTVDLHHVRLQRQAALAPEGSVERRSLLRESTTLRELELALTRIADITLVVSESEREVLLSDVPSADVRVLSLVHDRSLVPVEPVGRDEVLFVGSFDHPPNRDAVEWMCAEVMPLVRLGRPDAVLTVVGSNPPQDLARQAGPLARVEGWVADLEPYYASARVVVAPLRFGAGVKGKVAEGLTRGVPVVLTSLAVEGMHLRDGEEVLVADEPQAFADAVLRLFDDDSLWRSVSSQGADAVQKQFGPDVARAVLSALTAAPGPAVSR